MKYITLLVFPLLLASNLFAQQSSKSKSKDRFLEKEDPTNVVRVENCRFLNSPGNDYSPVYYKNGLVFVTARAKNGPQDKKSGATFSEIFFAPFDPNGEPIAPSGFSLEINSTLHEGPVSFSRDYKYMFFTRNNMRKGVQKSDGSGKVRLKIYMARRSTLDWADVRELPFNSDTYSCLHPSLSADGNTLYFASDMPGGFGGFDIYSSTYQSGSGWQTPVNLGPEVNSGKNELFPFIHLNGTLFFSSDGHNTLGGLDLFYLDLLPDGSKEVVNLGEPFNSDKDDLGFIMDDEGKHGFFASSRAQNSYGKDDIFSFRIEKGIEGVEKPVARPVQLYITDARTGQPLQGAAVRILKPTEDGFVSSSQQGYYDIDLAPLQDGESNVVSLQLKRKDAEDLGPADLYTNAAGKTGADLFKYRSYLLLVSLEGYQTAERFFSFETDELEEIRIALQDAPACHKVTGIVSTDQLGRRIVNASLRFTHKQSGQQARGRSNLNGEFEICLPLDGEYLLQVEREGFKPESSNLIVFAGQGAFKEVRLRPTELGGGQSEAGAFKAGSVMIMDQLNFEPNKATINQFTSRQLEAVYELMKQYPGMEIDLVAYTDARGDTAKNLALSEDRAKNAKTYLAYRGIAETRINAYGKGEQNLRNACGKGVTCTEEQHQLNVRYEVLVRKM